MPRSPRASKTNRAKKDLAEIAAYYGEDSLELELRFLTAVEDAFSKLAAMPEKGTKREYYHPKLHGLRMWPVPDFPKILIFYQTQDDRVEIVRVLHSSRNIGSLFLKRKSI